MSKADAMPDRDLKAKPIRPDEYKRLPIVRPVYEGALTPRLQQKPLRDAIGFLHRIVAHEDEADG